VNCSSNSSFTFEMLAVQAFVLLAGAAPAVAETVLGAVIFSRHGDSESIFFK